MKAELINPVIAAVQDHFARELGWTITRGRPFIKQEVEPDRRIPAMIGFAGKLKGTLVINFDPEVILAMDTSIHKRPKREIDSGALDTVVEFIEGIASKIQDKQYSCFPIVVQGTASQTSYHSSHAPLCFPLMTPAGDVVIEIAVREQELSETQTGNQTAEIQKIMDSVSGLTAGVARGIDRHNTIVEEISQGLTVDENSDSETVLAAVASLMKANEEMQSDLSSARKQLEDQSRQMDAFAADARTDSLTGLSNRREFDERIQRLLAAQIEKQAPATLMILDVDHFKRFNDQHGHLAGDEVLRRVSEVLKKGARDVDIPARYGGEEFAILFSNTTLEEAAPLAERVRKAIYRGEVQFEGKKLRVTASAGIAQARNGESEADWIKRADEALYAAKNAGRNCQHWHDGQQAFPLEDSNGDINIADLATTSTS